MPTLISHPDAAVLVEHEGAIAFLTLNRPEKRNALSLALMRELEASFRDISENDAIQVVVLRANGPVFSAGHDLSELVGQDEQAYRVIFDTCVSMMETIQAIRQPLIAAVQGPATAAGCQLVATCDLAVASEDAWFATPGVKIGLFCSTPMVAVSRAIGRKRMMEMLLTGDPIPAGEALSAGLINQVVPLSELDAAVRRLCEKIAALSPTVIGIGKQAFYRQIEMTQADAYAYTAEVMTQNALAAPAREGISAFLEKRKAHWPS